MVVKNDAMQAKMKEGGVDFDGNAFDKKQKEGYSGPGVSNTLIEQYKAKL